PPVPPPCPPAIPALPTRLPSASAASSAERFAHTRQSLAASMIVGPGTPAATDEPRDGDDESYEDERHEHIDVRTGELGPPRSRQQMAPEGVLGKEQRADDGDEEDSESQTRQRSLLDLLPGRDVQIDTALPQVQLRRPAGKREGRDSEDEDAGPPQSRSGAQQAAELGGPRAHRTPAGDGIGADPSLPVSDIGIHPRSSSCRFTLQGTTYIAELGGSITRGNRATPGAAERTCRCRR